MINKIKKKLYFPIAYYFRLFAKIRLLIWNPQIIVVTGSNGKTTLLHLLESQIGNKASYSHKANSTYGVPFDILGIKRKTLQISEWLYIFVSAPFKIFTKISKEKLYIVEADCDRPFEGKFLSTLLKPDITIWLSSSRTHTVNFDKKKYSSVEKAIAHEFGYFIENTKSLSIVNGDSILITQQLNRTKSVCDKIVKDRYLNKYELSQVGTMFNIDNKNYSFSFLLPEETYYSIVATIKVLNYLQLSFDPSFSNFKLPPGRSSIFRGIKNTTIIDSTYNATPASMNAILKMFKDFPTPKKWAVLGDMIELGNEEQQEHEKLAEILASLKLEKIILVGPRLFKNTYPKLKNAIAFEKPKEALDYLNANIKGKETILFKGARFLEGVIEHLLLDKNDITKLPRREKVWEIRRKKWGL